MLVIMDERYCTYTIRLEQSNALNESESSILQSKLFVLSSMMRFQTEAAKKNSDLYYRALADGSCKNKPLLFLDIPNISNESRICTIRDEQFLPSQGALAKRVAEYSLRQTKI